MKTETVAAIDDRDGRPQRSATERAVELLRKGDLVALPTETVYGLAADALKAEAAAKIFETKERPRFDPLIIHLPDKSWLERVANIATQNRELLSKLIERFWPGPLTVVLPKQEIVPDIVTAGLDTVAVRISAHPVFADVIAHFGGPLAAPSANRFGRVSPTAAAHVREELGGRIPLILDAGSAQHGIESTIVALEGDEITILRRGPITDEQLAAFAKTRFGGCHERVSAPGQLPSHYAPGKPLQIIADSSGVSAANAGLLAWHPAPSAGFAEVRQLSATQDLREAAANLFRYLRELDAMPTVEVILAEQVPEEGLGAAIMDRLRRAANATVER